MTNHISFSRTVTETESLDLHGGGLGEVIIGMMDIATCEECAWVVANPTYPAYCVEHGTQVYGK